jgi:hypothetical protein
MKKTMALLPVLLAIAPLFAPLTYIHAQTASTPDSLFQTIQSLDTQRFEAYNHCDWRNSDRFWPTIWSSITMSAASAAHGKLPLRASRTTSAAK